VYIYNYLLLHNIITYDAPKYIVKAVYFSNVSSRQIVQNYSKKRILIYEKYEIDATAKTW
jgi:hypothetical protein